MQALEKEKTSRGENNESCASSIKKKEARALNESLKSPLLSNVSKC
jgi:hypothetical protein